ncbi:MAG: GspE/PulE family protein [bacterium]|nr:GspE/PulE family protein [bacterium]
MLLTNEKLKEALVGPGIVDEGAFDIAVVESESSGKPLEKLLVEKDLIKDEQLGWVYANALGYKYVDLANERVDDILFNQVPEIVARSRGVIALNRTVDGIRVGMRDPEDLETIHLLEKRLGDIIIPYYITEQGLHEALRRYRSNLKEEFDKKLRKIVDPTISKDEKDDMMVALVDELLQFGYENHSSDIHIEPRRDNFLIRFRIDGVMHDMIEADKKVEKSILTRLKIMSGMRTDEHRAAQDGKLRVSFGDETIDVRVSIVPVTEGENIVMRILSAENRQFGLADLGLGEKDLEKVNRAIKNPHGMILVTGPTGSGKTTTVYAVLKILNRREVHISTIEDPVEYDIEGISQIQVDNKTNLTFAKGLRAIVRQDPDIIMVGEIRDEETAGIAVNSAMTGHLVLSTLHANDAATTLPRLLDMGVEPFLVASTVNVIIAQRLVRKVCESCRASHEFTEDEKHLIERDESLKELFVKSGHTDLAKVRVYKGSGCKVCGHTGYTGRIGVFEVLEMKENIKDLVVKHSSSVDIMHAAREGGMRTMLEDGISKVFLGVTTLEEVLRVTKT